MMASLGRLSGRAQVAAALKERQTSLGHSLPLSAFLLKPVQRILKYHLFLKNALEHWDGSDRRGRETIARAYEEMRAKAAHINQVKKRHEHASRVAEIQGQLLRWSSAGEHSSDLREYGELVLEGALRLAGTKTTRRLFLFEELLLIAKQKPDASLLVKDFIHTGNLMLMENLEKDPLSFQVLPFDAPKAAIAFAAASADQKREWTREIKRVMLEHHASEITPRAREILIQSSEQPERYGGAKLGRVPKYLSKRRKSVEAGLAPPIDRHHKHRSSSQSSLVVHRVGAPGAQRLSSPTPLSTAFHSDELPRQRKAVMGGRLEAFFESRSVKAVDGGGRLQRLLRASRSPQPRRSLHIRHPSDTEPRYFESTELPSSAERQSVLSSGSDDSAYGSNPISSTGDSPSTSETPGARIALRSERDSQEARLDVGDVERAYADVWDELEEFCQSQAAPSDPAARRRFPVAEERPRGLLRSDDVPGRSPRYQSARRSKAQSLGSLSCEAPGASRESLYDSVFETQMDSRLHLLSNEREGMPRFQQWGPGERNPSVEGLDAVAGRVAAIVSRWGERPPPAH